MTARGKPKGVLTAGSVVYQLSTMGVGEIRWIETTLDGYARRQRELNVANAGRSPSPEVRARISKALKGRPLPAETRAKMSAARRRA